MRKRKYTSLENVNVSSAASLNVPDDPTMPMPVIHNIVSTAQIASTCPVLDLDRICELLPGSSYDRKKFAAMTIRLSNPNCTILLFSSGNLVVTGGKTWYESILSCIFLRKFLQSHLVGMDFYLKSCEIQNIVAHVEVLEHQPAEEEFFLDLDAMYAKLNLQCTYQKQMFPGLIFRPHASPVVLLCFFSGKIVITGGKSQKDVWEGWKRLWPIVQAFISKKVKT
jgi:transcription initiation factor TFIID TATA-box-binding protein